MKLDRNTVYLMSFDGIPRDIVYGVWKASEDENDENDPRIRTGLSAHSISFIPTETIRNDDVFEFDTVHGFKVSFQKVDKLIYNDLKGLLIGSTAPEISNDEDVQEYLWDNRFKW